MQSQLVCAGCRNLLLYPSGATNVCCAMCNTITPVPPPAMEMAQIVCGSCRTLLMYTRGATSVRCSCCNTINLARSANPVAHVNCGRCHNTLMYPYGAPSVKCAICHFITNVATRSATLPIPAYMPHGSMMTPPRFSGQPLPHPHSQTVVVENPMSVDGSGKLALMVRRGSLYTNNFKSGTFCCI